MANSVFQAILTEKIETFKFIFGRSAKNIFWDEKKNKLIHPAEFGKYREMACKDFLRLFIPSRLEISEGFLINDQDETSTQCDIVVYDKNNTPLIESTERQRFFPVETVCAIGEIKSDLNKAQLKEAINKLARNKRLREHITSPTIIKQHGTKGVFNPKEVGADHIFSFIICNKFTFDISNLKNEINDLYDKDIKVFQKHNLILSITDGLLLYSTGEKAVFFPYTKKIGELKNKFVSANETPNRHFHYFSNYLFMATTAATILYPEMTNYISHKLDPPKELKITVR